MTNDWTPKDYTQFFLMDEPTHTIEEIRAEYSRQREIAMKRAAGLEKIGALPQAEHLRTMFPKLSAIPEGKVSSHLATGKSLLDDRAYSVKGIRQLQKAIRDETGELIPIGDVLPFNEYMKSWRLSAFSKLIVPSGEASDLYGEEYQEIGGSFSDFYTLYQQMRDD